MGKRGSKQSESKLVRCVKAPIRALCGARDLYVRSMTQCAGRTSHSAVMGLSGGPVSSIPRSFSASSSRRSDDEDLRELIRAASQKGLMSKIEMEIRQQQQQRSSAKKTEGLPRSFTVGIGRIDEEKACDFDDEELEVKPRVLYPRSKTYAAAKRTTGLFA